VGNFADKVKNAAESQGFALCGIVRLTEDVGRDELAKFKTWIDEGMHGDMQYLAAKNEQNELKRARTGNAAPWARSAVVVALNYNSDLPYSVEAAKASGAKSRGWISRYAWFESKGEESNTDYHDAILKRLRVVETEFAAAFQSVHPNKELKTWCYVDTGPIMERVLAKYAGIGWVGKNTCIIHPELGSWLFLGVMLCSHDFSDEQSEQPALVADRCGSCTRCIDACPTQAITEPYKIDARKCIAYLTIEKRGVIDEELRVGMGNHLFGCDICQDVCPWNGAENPVRIPPASLQADFQPRREMFSPELVTLAKLTKDEFNEVFRHSPIKRAKYEGLRRNLAIVMGNSGDRAFLPLLEEMASGPDSNVAEHAVWSIRKITGNIA